MRAMNRPHPALKLLGLALFLILADCVHPVPATREATFKFNATMEGGTRVAFTIIHDASRKGSVREVRWKTGRVPGRDRPDFDTTTKLYDLRATPDGAKVVCKAVIPLQTPVVTLAITPGSAGRSRQDPPQPPTVVETVTGTLLGVGDETNVYCLSERDRKGLTDFILRAHFPALVESP